ncbi:MAG: formylglycine-generating enzyme family protein, partial [Anaerolineae bacterium]|nr:formylglycine-generating enzyme family protein [Anaerolineae bacterium]
MKMKKILASLFFMVGGCWLLSSCVVREQVRVIDQMPMVRIPASAFIMGSDVGIINQSPAHRVNLSPYWIDQHEVTNAQYAACVEAGACDPPWAFDSETRLIYYEAEEFAHYPVQATTWRQADEYCAWVGG